MSTVKHVLITAATIAVVMAVVFRVPQLKTLVTGSSA